MNLVKNLTWSATRVAPAVRAWAAFWVVVVLGAGFALEDRLRVWPNVTEGAMRMAVSEAIAMRFNMIDLFDFSGWPIVPKTNTAARMTPKDCDLVA